MVWIRSGIFRAPKAQHIKEGLPNNGHVLNKRRRKHIKEGIFTKVSATLMVALLVPTQEAGLSVSLQMPHSVRQKWCFSTVWIAFVDFKTVQQGFKPYVVQQGLGNFRGTEGQLL